MLRHSWKILRYFFIFCYIFLSYQSIDSNDNSKIQLNNEILIERKKTVFIDGIDQTITFPYRCINNVSKLSTHEWYLIFIFLIF